MFKSLVAGCLLLMCSPILAVADGADPIKLTPKPQIEDFGWKSIHRIITLRLDSDGLGEQTSEFEYRATSRAGVDRVANETFGYDPNFEEVRFEGLETVKANGETIPVDPSAIHDQPSHADESSPYIDDQRQKLVAFPDVEPGDVIRGKEIMRLIKSPLGKGLTRFWAQRSEMRDEVRRFVIDAPADLPMQTQADGVVETLRRENGRIIRTVEFPRAEPRVLTEATSAWDVAPRYAVTTFASWQDFAATISALNAGKSTANEAIKAEVARIVAGAADDREKARRLSNWVAEHVRYVGIGLGNGGFVSEPASATFAERYGDCKAHATLLKAMLAEVGVDAHLVLINSENQFSAPALPVDNFDHEIVYVPAFDLFLDPTDPFGVFGTPLIEMGGKSALDLSTGQLRKLPLATPDDVKLVVETHTQMTSDGRRSGDTVLSGEGNGESYRRWQTTNFCLCGNTRATLEAMLNSHHYSGSGDYAFGDAHKLDAPFTIKAHFAEDKPWDIQRFGAAIWIDTPVDPSPNLTSLIHKDITGRAAACFPVDYTETNTFHLPDGIEVSELEKPFDVDDQVSGHTALGDVSAKILIHAAFTIDGNVIRLANHVRVGFDGPVCTSEIVDHVDDALSRWNAYRYTWVPLSSGAWYNPANWIKTMSEAQAKK